MHFDLHIKTPCQQEVVKEATLPDALSGFNGMGSRFKDFIIDAAQHWAHLLAANIGKNIGTAFPEKTPGAHSWGFQSCKNIGMVFNQSIGHFEHGQPMIRTLSDSSALRVDLDKRRYRADAYCHATARRIPSGGQMDRTPGPLSGVYTRAPVQI